MTEPGTTCVIGDDHAMLRTGVTEYLRSVHGIRVVGSAADGEATLALVLRRTPDVLVVDAAMPKMSGLEVCREVVAQAPDVAVIIYTGSDDIDLLEQALGAGARGFVLKNGMPDTLAAAIATVAAGGSHIDPALAGALLARRTAPPVLSPREAEVLALLADGKTTEETGQTLFLSPATVRTYAESAMRKIEARNRVHLVAKSFRMGILN